MMDDALYGYNLHKVLLLFVMRVGTYILILVSPCKINILFKENNYFFTTPTYSTPVYSHTHSTTIIPCTRNSHLINQLN